MFNIFTKCYIFQGMQEIRFIYTPNVSGEYGRPMFIHFDYEDYKANYMGKLNKTDKVYYYTRMVPLGEIKYFFTIRDSIQSHAQDQPSFKNLNSNLTVSFYDGHRDIEIKTINVIKNVHKKQCLDYEYDPTIQTLPRTLDQVYVPRKAAVQKRKWTFPISIFKDWKRDTDDHLKKCFEFDWSCNKVNRIIKNEEDLEKVKEIFRSNYRQYKDLYKYYASENPVGDIWAIQNKQFLQYIQLKSSYEYIIYKFSTFFKIQIRFAKENYSFFQHTYTH